MPGPTFGFVKLLASSGSHCTKWADEQHWQAGFESRLVPDLPLPFIPTLIGLRAFDLVSSRVWWEAATNIWHLFNVAPLSLNHRLDTDPELGACLFHKRRRELSKYSADGGDQAGFGVVGGHVGDVLDVWRNKVVQRVQVGGGGGPVREGYKVVALLLKPSLGLFGLVGRRRVLLPHPGSTTGHLIAPGDHHTLQHIQVHFSVDFQADFDDVRGPSLETTPKDHNRCWKLCFHHPWHVPVIRGNLDLHFEGAGNGPVVDTWIGREHWLYSGASPISLVEHCVTFRHDIRLLSFLGFVHNWTISRWSATKKENWFSLNGNGIMSSFLGQQFYRSTL